MKMAEMDLGNSIFEYGQIYVALSRVESLEGLYLSAFHDHKIKANPIVKEFYKNIPPIQLPACSSEEIIIQDSCEQQNPQSIENTKNVFARFAYKEPKTIELTEEIIEECDKTKNSVKIIHL